MTDFETHPRGTTRELQLSRELANVIAEEMQNPNAEIPIAIIQAYNRLYGFHLSQIQAETL